MPARRTVPARLLAVLALVAAAVALIIVVSGSVGGDDGRADRRTRVERSRAERGKSQRNPQTIPRFYEVQPGDSLLLISQRTGVSVERIESLNPGIDDLTLQIGTRLQLR